MSSVTIKKDYALIEMKKHLTYIALVLYSISTFSQNNSIDKLLKKYNSNTVAYLDVNTLDCNKDRYIILDAREKVEFTTSHLKNAVHVGYNDFSIDILKQISKNKKDTIVVYCSVGVRSEDIGERIKNANYSNVYNLYGGIFEWKNKGFHVVDTTNKRTEKVHVFSKKWNKYLTNGIKIY